MGLNALLRQGYLVGHFSTSGKCYLLTMNGRKIRNSNGTFYLIMAEFDIRQCSCKSIAPRLDRLEAHTEQDISIEIAQCALMLLSPFIQAGVQWVYNNCRQWVVPAPANNNEQEQLEP